MFEKIEFVKSVFEIKLLPKNRLKEVVLCGRSNVGKSTFINSLFVAKKKIAKVSSTPGKTRSINYYSVDDKFFLVDLPGFGFASVAKSEKEKWNNLIDAFFAVENERRILLHLIDIRHPDTKMDLEFSKFIIGKDITPIVILTKHDKAKQSEISEAKRKVKLLYESAASAINIFSYSAITGYGKKDLVKCLTTLLV